MEKKIQNKIKIKYLQQKLISNMLAMLIIKQMQITKVEKLKQNNKMKLRVLLQKYMLKREQVMHVMQVEKHQFS